MRTLDYTGHRNVFTVVGILNAAHENGAVRVTIEAREMFAVADAIAFALDVLDDLANWAELDEQAERLFRTVAAFKALRDEVLADVAADERPDNPDRAAKDAAIMLENTDDGRRISLHDFLVINLADDVESIDESECERLRTMTVGETITFGGGAVASSTYRRIA